MGCLLPQATAYNKEQRFAKLHIIGDVFMNGIYAYGRGDPHPTATHSHIVETAQVSELGTRSLPISLKEAGSSEFGSDLIYKVAHGLSVFD